LVGLSPDAKPEHNIFKLSTQSSEARCIFLKNSVLVNSFSLRRVAA
jgi:hypothetical protein